LVTAGPQTIAATDTANSSVTGSTGIIIVPGNATHFDVSAPSTATAGTPFSYTVTARDQFNNVASGYTGTVHFTSGDGQATLPPDYTFTSGNRASLDNGSHTFGIQGAQGAILGTAGVQSLTATDTTDNTIAGTANIQVPPGPTSKFAVSTPPTATAGN